MLGSLGQGIDDPRPSADLARGAALPVRAGKDDLRVRIEVVWAFQ